MQKFYFLIINLIVLFYLADAISADLYEREELIKSCGDGLIPNEICRLLTYNEVETEESLCQFLEKVSMLDKELRENFIDARIVGNRSFEDFSFLNKSISCQFKVTVEFDIIFEKNSDSELKKLNQKLDTLKKFQREINIVSMDFDGDVVKAELTEYSRGNNVFQYSYKLTVRNAFLKSIETSELLGKKSVYEVIRHIDVLIKHSKDYYMEAGFEDNYFWKKSIDRQNFKEPVKQYIQKEQKKSKKEIENLERWKKNLNDE